MVPAAGSPPDPRPALPLDVVGSGHGGPVDVDTGAAGREQVAISVAAARIGGARSARTAEPGAARRAAHVIDAIVAARPDASA